ncbi:SHOCT domain-containing protein [Mucilaginibacter sp. McL0603]|uniref:SHOCT domain-containing protein n=1 Tax=Mucilaginibacter sp. McL0603 TaxID=3415670 RepID=UPI003CF72B99
MGSLGAPEIILILIVLGLFALFPVWGYRAGSKRTVGPVGGLLLGLFLGLIGIIIIYCTGTTKVYDPNLYNYQDQSTADELQKYKQLFDSGAITEAEYNVQKGRLLNQ